MTIRADYAVWYHIVSGSAQLTKKTKPVKKLKPTELPVPAMAVELSTLPWLAQSPELAWNACLCQVIWLNWQKQLTTKHDLSGSAWLTKRVKLSQSTEHYCVGKYILIVCTVWVSMVDWNRIHHNKADWTDNDSNHCLNMHTWLEWHSHLVSPVSW